MRIWNNENFKLVNSLKSDSAIKDFCIVSNDYEEDIASIHYDLSVRLWKPTSELEPMLLSDKFFHAGEVFAVTFLNNTKYLASGSQDQNIIIWDLIGLSLFKTIKGHSNDVILLLKNIKKYLTLISNISR